MGKMISVPKLRITDTSRSAKRHLRLEENLYGDHVTSNTTVVDAESCAEYVTVAHLACVGTVSVRFLSSFHFSRGQNRKSRSYSFLALSLLRNLTKTLATLAIADQISTLIKRSRNSDCGFSRSLAFAVSKS